MAVLYTLDITDDVYTVTSTEPTETITYSVNKYDYCTETFSSTADSSGTILAGEDTTLSFSTDGYFKVTLTNESLDTDTYSIYYYDNLLSSIIATLPLVICDDSCCKDCYGTQDQCEDLTLLYYKMNSLYDAINAIHGDAENIIRSYKLCFIDSSTSCLTSRELVQGYQSFLDEDIIKILIAIDYVTLYYHTFNAMGYGTEAYMTTKFKMDDYTCCFRKLGIDLNAIQTLIETI